MIAKVAVVVPHFGDNPGPWADLSRLASLLKSIFSEINTEAICFFGEKVTGQLFKPSDFQAAVCIPPDTFPLPSIAEALLETSGVCTWVSAGPRAIARCAVSFGTSALVAFNACHHLPRRTIAGHPSVLARHLAVDHGVRMTGPRRGLVAVDDPLQLSRALLGGKDVTLRRLAPLLSSIMIDPGVSIDWTTWSIDPDGVRDRVARLYGGHAVIVRSCAEGEDGWEQSHAGAYASLVVAKNGSADDFAEAINRVFHSYLTIQKGSRVFVQRWLGPVDAACVVTTKTLAGAPYYVAAVDDISRSSNQVTGGASDNVSTQYVHRMFWLDMRHGQNEGVPLIPEVHRRFLAASAEVEHVVGSNSLDLELAVVGEAVHLLQVRPLVAVHASESDLSRSYELVKQGMRQLRGLFPRCDNRVCGDGLMLSNMADWNPAEMIGRRPAPLALSLYKTLITDSTWAHQRAKCGYTDLRGVPLMQVVAGSPYVDVLASLTSFLPAVLSHEDGQDIVQAQCDRLRSEPALHDKIEFAVAVTCWTPSVEKRLAQLSEWGASDGPLRRLHDGLVKVTSGIIAGLDSHVAALEAHGLPTDLSAHEVHLDETLGVTKRLALIFAHLARAAFVAVDMLRGLEELGLIDDREAWMRGGSTAATDLQRDAAAVIEGTMTWSSLVGRYRWTRPGTYDPTVPTYGQHVEGYLRPLLHQPLLDAPAARTPSLFHARDVKAVDAALAPVGLDAACAEVFFREAIRAREAGKAMYAAWVSAALESAVGRARQAGLGRLDMTYLKVAELRGDRATWMSAIARRRDDARAQAALLELPDVITRPDDLLAFTRGPGKPNFVGSKSVSGPAHFNPAATRPPPPGAVVVVESADPGYDWVLSLGIAALVTAYGGVNSHMAIRCAELGLPAAIGVGPQQFELCRSARWIRVDACARRLIVSS